MIRAFFFGKMPACKPGSSGKRKGRTMMTLPFHPKEEL